MKSSFTDIFIRRPVLAIVVNLVILIAGGQAIYNAFSGSGDFTVRQYPRSENASVTVTTVYIGANAELVRGFITSPLERAIASADGIDYLESSSTQSMSTITARLKLNYDPTKALAEISSKVDQVRADLPPESEVPIINIATADSQFAQMYLRFGSDLLEANEVTDYLVRVVQPALTAVPGVQKADILGGRTYAMRIWLKPDRMAALDVSPSNIRQALARNNYLSALGQTKGSYIQVNLTANTNLTTVDDFKALPIKEDGASIVRLEEVADVVLGAENYDSDVRFSGEKAVFMGIWVLPTANSLDVIDRVTAQLEKLETRFPVGFTGGVAYDATEYIDDAINEVIRTLSETLAVVVIVIFLFLGRIRTVLVPVIAIPVSLIGAVFLMQVFGFSVNLLTLLAIVLSVGLVVDDAIVVVENVERHLREGKTPVDAAILSARELVGPIIAMTLTLAAVYTPIAARGGLTGSLFREFAITLAGAVLISGVVALTLSPMMASLLLTQEGEEKGLAGAINRGFDRLRNLYGRLLDSSLEARPAVYVMWIGLSVLTLPMLFLSTMTTELAPAEDQGIVFGVVQGPSNATLEQTLLYTDRIQETFESVPEYEQSFQITTPGGGFGGMIAKPWGERERTIFEIRQELFPGLSSLPGVTMFPILPAALPGASNFPVEFIIASTAETEEIYEVAKEIATRAGQTGLFAMPPEIDLKIDLPQSEIVLDRDLVTSLGLDMQQVGADMGAMFGGGYVNRFSKQGRSYKVIPQIKRMERLSPDQLANIHVTGPQGELVPLSTFATVENSTEPRSLNRFNQLNAVKISGIPMVPLDQALKTLESLADEVMPTGYVVDYGGESRQLRTASGGFVQLFGMALLLIFLVLAAQFNSFRDPLVILAGSTPLAMFGALIFTSLRAPGDGWVPNWTWGWTTSWNIYSQVGMITLIGLVAKNAILIVEFANVLQRQGKSKLDAIRESARTRLRPILMTTAATVFGHIMLIFVSGAGAAARNSIGLVLVNGMAIGTLFTLFIVPSVYMLIAKDHKAELKA
ncbi:efflux RND transporter permease subunit [Pelagicoccus sp. SDUM812003]|uniref:efflux RND transporter permease subunit n=1 Tax=Pelagicoccus sp. SDUM812003 TaxID=3041267 RepID=UPI00280DEA2E|nr:efflux RND transporter permease subunit [Pelagicoccus sp. SDUM812003]MDQ8204645.1 efflux RND transporter permease subunit [Pelagicoccus sp. SDUM812003]